MDIRDIAKMAGVSKATVSRVLNESEAVSVETKKKILTIIEEVGYLGLAPTSTILVMLALTDSLALLAAKDKGFTERDYYLRHHGGYLGQVAKKRSKKR